MDNDRSPIADTEVHYLRSEHVGDELKLFVGHCGSVGQTSLPVLYLTDANGYFGSAVDIIRGMQVAFHLPPLLVVGVGYRLGGMLETVAVRTRDLTPSADVGFARAFPDQSRMGGAAGFLEFFRDELIPWVASRYPVDPDDRTYFGHSLGGLFGTYVLLRAPETFRGYALGSPSLWWNHDEIFELETEYARTHDDLPAHVYLGIGASETQDGRVREAVNLPEDQRGKATSRFIDMVADMERMVSRLAGRGYPSLTIERDVFPDEFHVTVAPLVLSRGLRRLYDAPQ